MRYLFRKKYSFAVLIALAICTLVIVWSSVAHSSPLPTNIGGWFAATPLPEVLASRNAIAKGDTLFVIGGKTPSDKPSAEVYTAQVQTDGSLGAWARSTPLPVPVYLHAVVASATHLYVSGAFPVQPPNTYNRLLTIVASCKSSAIG